MAKEEKGKIEGFQVNEPSQEELDAYSHDLSFIIMIEVKYGKQENIQR